jgi:hypothetical protein
MQLQHLYLSLFFRFFRITKNGKKASMLITFFGEPHNSRREASRNLYIYGKLSFYDVLITGKMLA